MKKNPRFFIQLDPRTPVNMIKYLPAEAFVKFKEKYKITNKLFWDFTISEFCEALDFPIEFFEKRSITVFGFFSEFIEFENFCRNIFFEELEKIKIKNESSVVDFTIFQSFLIFAQNYFSLKNFEEAEKIKLIDIYLAKKAIYAENLANTLRIAKRNALKR